MPTFILAWLLSSCALPSAEASTPTVGFEIDDFALRDSRGTVHRLADWNDRPLIAVVFLGVECPLAKLYVQRLNELASEFESRGLQIVGIDSNQQDSPAELAEFVRLYEITFPILRDPGNLVADRFGAVRTPEVFLLDQQRTVRYQGRIDDQLAVAVRRASAERRDLAEAIEELLAGKQVSLPVTESAGCHIGRLHLPTGQGTVTYSKQIAPILQEHCQTCHRSGQIAPFPLTNYQEAVGWAKMIREVVADERMPPWHADPRYGHFANDSRLSDEQRQQIFTWVRDGAPEGDPADLPPERKFADDWSMGRPDQVFTVAKPFDVPAQGIIEYQMFEVDPGFTEDRWISAAEIRSTNRAVMHHATVFLKAPGEDVALEEGTQGSYCLAATALGTPPLRLPAGMAKRIPAGCKFLFVVHYVAVGSPQQDQISLGVKYADPREVHKEVSTKLMYDLDLQIPPRTADHRVEQSWRIDRDILLLAMFPHMHLRGRSFQYEVRYPDGTSEVLLSVPRYDFNWQNRYELAEPKRLPAGAVITCTAHYDNSSNNPANPDPNATVIAGKQTTDEMFNGYFEFALADEDLQKFSLVSYIAGLPHIFRPGLMFVSLFGIFCWLKVRKHREPKPT
jgi:peroxiredoxin